ncbi:MAG: response regulator [Deltaproteobacteria bacterium]|nr:response regulator [Deltaproteobacteria bacterium]
MTKKRILSVEDEPAIQKTLKLRLEASGYEVLCATDGAEGLELARQEKPDLIILDLMLPKRDGNSVCRLLKFDQRYREIPILMLTARGLQKDRETGVKMGADAYLTKPYDSVELIATVRKLLGEAP